MENILRRLSHNSEPRRIQIDQICINQKDDAEKTEQVKFMGLICQNGQSPDLGPGSARKTSKLEKSFQRCIERLAAMEAFNLQKRASVGSAEH
jgi:hypothetical protein